MASATLDNGPLCAPGGLVECPPRRHTNCSCSSRSSVPRAASWHAPGAPHASKPTVTATSILRIGLVSDPSTTWFQAAF